MSLTKKNAAGRLGENRSYPRLGKEQNPRSLLLRSVDLEFATAFSFMLGAVIVTNIDERRVQKKLWRLEGCAAQDKGKSSFSFCLGEYTWQVLDLDNIQ